LVSANVGSLGGLIAIKRQEAHLAGSHLLDPNDGTYNISDVKSYLPGVRVKIFGFVDREQGLMIHRGNPKDITGMGDLARPEVRFVNRQRGAGTRFLLDYHLNFLGMSKDAILGYNHEEYTHLGVAAAIASDRADCGLGIPAAAQALGLDFVPLFKETYHLIIPVVHAESSLLEPLFFVLQDLRFKQDVLAMPGYDVKDMGKLIAEV
jgi:putative molybdopterin biosynthesis protein